MKSKHATININDSVWVELEEPFDVLYWSLYSDVAIYVQEYGISGWGGSISVSAETSYSVNTSVQKIRVKSQVGNADVNYSLLGFIVFRIGGKLPTIQPVSIKTSDYTLTELDYSIVADATSNPITITLPLNPAIGQVYNIACLNSDNAVYLSLNGKNFYNSSSNIRLFKGENLTIQYDGTQWIGA